MRESEGGDRQRERNGETEIEQERETGRQRSSTRHLGDLMVTDTRTLLPCVLGWQRGLILVLVLRVEGKAQKGVELRVLLDLFSF